MTTEHEELKRLAEAATPGPWFQVGYPWNPKGDFVCSGSEDPHIGKYVADTEDFDGEVENSFENAAFIAAANPSAILDLLRQLEEAQKDADRYRWLRLALSDRSSNGRSHYFCSISSGHPEELDAAIDAALSKVTK